MVRVPVRIVCRLDAMTTETWRDVPGYEGRYRVSDLGRVQALDHPVRVVARGTEAVRTSPGRILRPGSSPSGHLSVSLGRRNSVGVHRLVLLTFVGEPDPGHEARHLNGRPEDNRLSNLAWGTRGQNIRDDKWHGKLRTGYRLRVDDVLRIKGKLAGGESVSATARSEGIPRPTIDDIKQGRSHADVS